MAAITLQQRDLVDTRDRLEKWFQRRFDSDATISELSPANRAAGWSSETLAFSTQGTGATAEFVIRIPPSGGGMFAEYDLEGQTRTQELLRSYGVATPSPVHLESDTSWIGSRFILMPRIVGHTPSDTSYATRGWLFAAGPEVQKRVHDDFLKTLATLQSVPVSEAPWLTRDGEVGNGPELRWWREYLAWGTDNRVPDLMVEAFDWLERNQPTDPGPLSVCWGDARLSNTIFDDAGTIVGVLDWEQACIGAAEADLGWWLATRRQTREVQGVTTDPELPGFDRRDEVIRRYQDMIGRELIDLDWYEQFSMIRMGCCILRTQVLLRSIGLTDHGFLRAPILPAWVIEAIHA
ncbi:phosphotransferase family protein [Mycobacteroides abscessus]|uniref:phosphotransferase family protein n=1 Tax=Mycobacteroides abscessus TaxID=36809 RepID=UPI000926C48A|nr:phosphotransferase family protein [Mycobacteroides abscessus]MDO3333888.1 phosphotransferase family protein [Mycobacteroides abscessus subsp. bolletii]QSM86895.1 phosphotransferase family protein [Mycobacteroides abscessus subsp. bolletii]SIB88888.1 putative aminoglycoside phosphotransferase [Mycobacteroides abscessus subsp. bolletii]SKS88839.1 putative aminoglycoside phosphotransferase [Mycobacteroides abscessus subsp. bolletii]SKT11823.1 putative aminoglycoside phosphotransferase [Mycobac